MKTTIDLLDDLLHRTKILATAQELGCRTPYSEDFCHGQSYGGFTVINPFLQG